MIVIYITCDVVIVERQVEFLYLLICQDLLLQMPLVDPVENVIDSGLRLVF